MGLTITIIGGSTPENIAAFESLTGMRAVPFMKNKRDRTARFINRPCSSEAADKPDEQGDSNV